MAGQPVALVSRPHARPQAPPEDSAAADVLATDVAGLRALADEATADDVDRALRRSPRSLGDFAVLLSPAAAERLEDLARRAHEVTLRRFGRAVRLFAPLYLSTQCVSVCTYCGFSAANQIARRTLAPEQALTEARALLAQGFRHLLLVSGEHARIVSPDYLVECVRTLAAEVPSISVEVQAWDTDTYRRLVEAGCEGLVIYQETYDRATYASV